MNKFKYYYKKNIFIYMFIFLYLVLSFSFSFLRYFISKFQNSNYVLTQYQHYYIFITIIIIKCTNK
jgi:hypothetical protein